MSVPPPIHLVPKLILFPRLRIWFCIFLIDWRDELGGLGVLPVGRGEELGEDEATGDEVQQH